MLVLFESVAKKIKPYQKISYFIAVVFIIFLAVPVIFPIQAESVGLDFTDGYGKLGLLSCIWLLLLNIVTSIFINIPKAATESDSFFMRIKLKVKRFFYFILALLLIVLTLVILVLSIRLLRV